MKSLKKTFLTSLIILSILAGGIAFIGCEKESTTQMSLGDASWREVGEPNQPTFLNGWTNYNTTAYSTCAFRKDGQNMVYLKGTITNGAQNSDIFVLPEGYRPSQLLMFNPYGGTYNSEITVFTDGTVFKGPNYNTFAVLDGIVFHADH